jgi:hypothetical protein
MLHQLPRYTAVFKARNASDLPSPEHEAETLFLATLRIGADVDRWIEPGSVLLGQSRLDAQ